MFEAILISIICLTPDCNEIKYDKNKLFQDNEIVIGHYPMEKCIEIGRKMEEENDTVWECISLMDIIHNDLLK